MASSSPAHQEVGVYLDAVLSYTFDYALDEESLRTGSVVLYDAEDNKEVRGALSYDSATFTATLLANKALTPHRRYTWTFAGADDDTMLPVKRANGTPITTSIWIDFQTGNSYTPREEIVEDEEAAQGVIQDGQSLSQRASDSFKVVGSIPAHLDSSIDVRTGSLSITFSEALNPAQNFASLIRLIYAPLVRETFYFNDNKFNEFTTPRIPGQAEVLPGADIFAMPTGVWSLSVDNKTLTWTKDSGQRAFNANAFVRIIISGNLLNSTGKKLNARQDEELYFLTELYPMYTSPEAIFFRLNGIQGMVSEEVVLQHILTHSIRASRLGKVSLVQPTRAAQSYAESMTVIQILDDRNIQQEISRGKAISLADLSVTYSFPRGQGMQSSTIRMESAKEADVAKRWLLLEAGQNDLQIGQTIYASL